MNFDYYICKEKRVLLCADNSVDFLAYFNKCEKKWVMSKYDFKYYSQFTLEKMDSEVVMDYTNGINANAIYGEHLNYLVDCDIW